MSLAFTSGASRAMSTAAVVAVQSKASTIEPAHLLWGLLLDESRAAMLLATHNITIERLQLLCRFDQSTVQQVQESAPPPDGELLSAVVFVARSEALANGAAEIGTEHLLTALARVESPAQQLLEQHGLTAHAAAGTTVPNSDSEPLFPDEAVCIEAASMTDRADAYRLIDASANRLREGLRVLEDFARFSLGDRHLSSLLKDWRHRFADVVRTVDPSSLLAFRDTSGDVGTSIHTQQEGRRDTLLEVAQAAFKRTQEAARTLEECGKIVDGEFSRNIGALRYELYTLEKAVLGTRLSRQRLEGCRVYLLLTEALCRHGSWRVLKAALQGGVGIVQIREKSLPDRELLANARRVRAWTREANVLLIINDRPDIAALCDADGVHVGQDELLVNDARRIVGPGKLVGVSTHSLEQARQAVLDGADYIGVGPVYPSTTKSFSQFVGLDLVRQVADEITLPAFAIGGIQVGNAAEVIAAGAKGLAVSSAVCGADDPEAVVRELRTLLGD